MAAAAAAAAAAATAHGAQQRSGPEQLPLFYEAGDRTRFAYALFLLNKDIEQLLHAHGLAGAGPSQLLQNLYLLISAATSALPPPTLQQLQQQHQPQQEQHAGGGGKGGIAAALAGGAAAVQQQRQPQQTRPAVHPAAAATESLTPWAQVPLAAAGSMPARDAGPQWAPVPAFWAGGLNFVAGVRPQ